MGEVIKKEWGYEEIIEENTYYKIKLIKVYEGCRTSLQYHKEKVETHIYSNKEIIQIPPGKIHRIVGPVDIVEVCHGDDKDIIRLDDDYGRAVKDHTIVANDPYIILVIDLEVSLFCVIELEKFGANGGSSTSK